MAVTFIDEASQLPVDRVSLFGRTVQPEVVTITTTPLAAGGIRSSGVIDLMASPGIAMLAYIINGDTVTQFDWIPGDGTAGENPAISRARVTVPKALGAQDVQFIPPFRPIGRNYVVTVRNQTPTPQTRLRVFELRYRALEQITPQNLRGVLAQDLAIRDTATHSKFTDPQFVFDLVRTVWGGGKVPIYVDNQLDQEVTVTVRLQMLNVITASLGTIAVPAGSKKVITNQDFPGLDVPSEVIDLLFTCSVAPTSGVVNAYIDTLVGGSA
ncbi:MAG TPA: hypothetical protein VF226_04840 [Hyphomicrobiaceae bacterium]